MFYDYYMIKRTYWDQEFQHDQTHKKWLALDPHGRAFWTASRDTAMQFCRLKDCERAMALIGASYARPVTHGVDERRILR